MSLILVFHILFVFCVFSATVTALGTIQLVHPMVVDTSHHSVMHLATILKLQVPLIGGRGQVKTDSKMARGVGKYSFFNQEHDAIRSADKKVLKLKIKKIITILCSKCFLLDLCLIWLWWV